MREMSVAGAGGGGMAVVGNVIISDAVPLKSRGLYQGCACNHLVVFVVVVFFILYSGHVPR